MNRVDTTTHAAAAEIDALARRVHGPVTRPGGNAYDAERSGFQTGWRHRPSVIVGATGPADVRAAVELAAAHGLPVAVEATGHGRPAAAAGGMLINTRRMVDVRLDAAGRAAWLAAGVRTRRLVDATTPAGLAPLTGSAGTVGVVSYTLGGGLGLLARRYGYAADHVHAIDVVTADGRPRHVTAETDPDLFWALRGGRGNFGVVTGLRVGLVPITRVYGGGLFFGADLIEDALQAWRQWTTTLPDELTSSVGLVPMPDIPAVPEPIRGRHVAHIRIAYTGDAATGQRLVAPLRAVGPRLMDSLGELPYAASGSIYNDPPEPHAYRGTNAMLHALDAAAVRTVLDLAGPDAPVPCVVELRHLGGALARPPLVPNAVGHRAARYLLRVLSPLAASDPATISAAAAAHRSLVDAMTPWATGGRSLNFLYGESTADDVRAAYAPGDLSRLSDLGVQYDPANLFRHNLNLPRSDDGPER